MAVGLRRWAALIVLASEQGVCDNGPPQKFQPVWVGPLCVRVCERPDPE